MTTFLKFCVKMTVLPFAIIGAVFGLVFTVLILLRILTGLLGMALPLPGRLIPPRGRGHPPAVHSRDHTSNAPTGRTFFWSLALAGYPLAGDRPLLAVSGPSGDGKLGGHVQSTPKIQGASPP